MAPPDYARRDASVAQARQQERALAGIRVVFAAASLGAIYLDASEPAHYATFTYGLLAGYLAYGSILFLVLRLWMAGSTARVAIHAVDIGSAALLTLFTEGPNSPFFALFGFALLAAAYRWGLWQTVGTGLACAVLYGTEALLVSTSRWPRGFVEGDFELNRFIIRFTYLLLLAGMLGYLAERQKAARAELAAVASAAERGRLARELHDGVVQSLLGLRMRLEVLRRGDADGTALREELQRNEEVLSHEVVNLRTLMFALNPIDAAHHDLAGLTAELVADFERASGVSARFVGGRASVRASPQVCHELGRIVQEALVNVHKHSGARHLLVSLAVVEGTVQLVVEDDGCGFDFSGAWSHAELDERGKGPRVIKERARLLGGTLLIRSTPGAGARLELRVPV